MESRNRRLATILVIVITLAAAAGAAWWRSSLPSPYGTSHSHSSVFAGPTAALLPPSSIHKM
jgi:hypothetical protein